MKKILLGIALIMFGMAAIMLYSATGLGDGSRLFGVLGMVMPFIGILIAIIGAAEKDK